MPSSNTITTSAYVQREKSLMPCHSMKSGHKRPRATPLRQSSGLLEAALRQDLGDRALLHLDDGARGDLHANARLAHVLDAAGKTAAHHHFVALGESGEQVAVLFLALHLRADHHEIEDAEEDGHHDQRGRAEWP